MAHDSAANEPQPPLHMDVGFDPAHFSRIFTAMADSPAFLEAARAAVGPDYAGQFSFSNMAQLRRLSDRLALAPGVLLADLCCGNGGPGLYLAGRSGCRLVGVDWAAAGVAHGRRQAAAQGLAAQAHFVVADITRPLFRDASFDAVMNIDGFYFGVGLAWLYREVYRILRPGGRFAFYFMVPTPYGLANIPPRRARLRAQHMIDHVAALEAVGFRNARGEDYTGEFAAIIRAWRDAYERCWDRLVAEMGAAVVHEIADEMYDMLWWAEHHHEQRWLFSARKPSAS